jgi:hypothetical protein
MAETCPKIEVDKVSKLPFEASVLENLHLDFHEQSLKLHELPKIEDNRASSQLVEAPLS